MTVETDWGVAGSNAVKEALRVKRRGKSVATYRA